MNNGAAIFHESAVGACDVSAASTPDRMLEPFDQNDIAMSFRMIFDRAFSFVSEMLIKIGGLEGVCYHDDLRTTATERFGFRGVQERSSEASTPMTFIDPEVRNLAARAPRVAADARYHFTRFVLDTPTQ